MGRHETFENATPLDERLLAGTALGRHGHNGEAAADAPDRRALVAYASWLHCERTQVCRELYPHLGWKAATFIVGENAGFNYHRRDTPPPSTRAKAVLSLIGCDWSKDGYLGIGDDGSPEPLPAAFPHPDARLADLAIDFWIERERYEVLDRQALAAHEEFERRMAEHLEEDAPLWVGPDRLDYWTKSTLVSYLDGSRSAVTRAMIEAARRLGRDALQHLVPLAEAREARRNRILLETDYEHLRPAANQQLSVADEAACRVYRTVAHTLHGLVIKARILRVDRPDLWVRPSAFERSLPAEWHEIALAEIADGVDHLLTVGGRSGTEETGYPSVTPPAGLIADILTMRGEDACGGLYTSAAGGLRRPANPLPEPGSDAAKAAFAAACRETDRLSHAAVHGYPDLDRPDGMFWCKDTLSHALDRGEIEPREYARLYPQAAEREHRIEAAAIATNIGALFALAYADEYPERDASLQAGQESA